jgi:hypothetical protein
MFEQYNMLQKIIRIIIFVMLSCIVMKYVPEQKLDTEDMCKLVSAMTLIFIIYDFYYPAVRIELKKEDIDKK